MTTIEPGTQIRIKGPDGAWMKHTTRRETFLHWTAPEPEGGRGWDDPEALVEALIVDDTGQEWSVMVPALLATSPARVASGSSEDLYLIILDAMGNGRRCSCPGYVHRGTCRHMQASALRALMASIQEMLAAGYTMDDVWTTWRDAGRETHSLGARCARMAYKASQALTEANIPDRLLTLHGPPRRKR